jgi:hypothetical protein
VAPRPTSACSRLATSRFFNYILPAKLVLVGVGLAGPQSADARRWAAGYNSSLIEIKKQSVDLMSYSHNQNSHLKVMNVTRSF